MKKIANAIALVFIAVSVYAFVEAGTFPPGSNGALGPGFFPRVLSVLVIFLSILELINSRHAKVPEGQEEVLIFKKENMRVWIALFASIIYIWSLKIVGFVIMTPVYLIAMFLYFKVKNKVVILAISLGVTAALYYVFVMLLNVKLPMGILF